jgi:SAM-dependent methyltransferase
VAQRKTQRYAGLLTLVRADMRHIPFEGCFDAVAQLFTAFGYFPSDEENASVFSEVHRALRPGGRYMLDFLNARAVVDDLRPHTEDIIEGGRLIQERRVENGRIIKDITIDAQGESKHFQESVRLFERDELAAMLEDKGFEVERVFGSYDGIAFHSAAPRCILLARKRP